MLLYLKQEHKEKKKKKVSFWITVYGSVLFLIKKKKSQKLKEAS